MADSSSRNNSLRISRLRGSGSASRNGSVRRSSALIDEYRQSSGSFPSLRSAGSRYSLNEQFAATRREYEFGDDDASSIYERMTVASDVGEVYDDKGMLFDEFMIPEEDVECAEDSDVSDLYQADYYEVLCLPRDAELSQDQIRQAYYRSLLLLYPDNYPAHFQRIIRRHFQRVQEAFETLIDPHRRAAYDETLSSGNHGEGRPEIYEDIYKNALSSSASNAISPDLDVRLGGAIAAVPGTDPSTWKSRPALGFTLGHTVQVGVPALEKFMQRGVSKVLGAVAGKAEEAERPGSLKLGTPTLTVTGAVHGLFGDMSPAPVVLLASRSTTPSDTRSPRLSVTNMPDVKLSRLSSLDCAEEVWKSPHDPTLNEVQWQKASKGAAPIALPEGILTARLSQPVIFPGSSEPTFLDVTVGSPALGVGCPLPRVSVGLHHKLSHGTAYVRSDSGQWLCSSDRKGLLLGGPSRVGRSLLSGALPFSAAPAVEMGFTTDPNSFGDLQPGSNGLHNLRGKTPFSNSGNWTISATTTGMAIAGYLRYSRDLVLRHSKSPAQERPPRVEVELCTGTLQGSYIALRNLLSVGRFSTAGLEVGISQHSLHLSIHWSRLSQRISLPVLLIPRVFSSPSLIFWAGALPMVGLATVELLRQYWRRPRRHTSKSPSQPAVQASIARRRTEADYLATLLGGPIDARQKRHPSLGDLVILNAKFGVRDDDGSWAAEEVADVTVALAALVDRDGRLIIPRGIRKGNLLGFWDPAPDREKVLLVRYEWKGKEAIAEVKEYDELCLPSVEEIHVS